MDCSPPGSSVHGIFQATVLERVAISFCGGSSPPRDRTRLLGLLHCRWALCPLSRQGSPLALRGPRISWLVDSFSIFASSTGGWSPSPGALVSWGTCLTLFCPVSLSVFPTTASASIPFTAFPRFREVGRGCLLGSLFCLPHVDKRCLQRSRKSNEVRGSRVQKVHGLSFRFHIAAPLLEF